MRFVTSWSSYIMICATLFPMSSSGIEYLEIDHDYREYRLGLSRISGELDESFSDAGQNNEETIPEYQVTRKQIEFSKHFRYWEINLAATQVQNELEAITHQEWSVSTGIHWAMADDIGAFAQLRALVPSRTTHNRTLGALLAVGENQGRGHGEVQVKYLHRQDSDVMTGGDELTVNLAGRYSIAYGYHLLATVGAAVRAKQHFEDDYYSPLHYRYHSEIGFGSDEFERVQMAVVLRQSTDKQERFRAHDDHYLGESVTGSRLLKLSLDFIF